ncbi:ribosomal protection tetracycline resistance protein [Evansella caseinilytica]|uniref:Ribosomal protection tetracycline resistance protein n=1 Tax=Evansella caseinilytica TaxID=1503961 RepID=A0A1H3STV1_9BACI|nr:TetM/TetW/TetO/TetS family tetracycline resistance ribosomal protection protein [Evansella caseinilytica]SDZ41374.1 ribosomal protection tetracycline resistance protein [Evansella caseinilytica]
MKILNIGVLAHVDAGKTTLTEQILHQTGILAQAGSVDQGTTVTDSLEIERRRGITVKAAAVSFTVGDLKVNLIDTPGHADFIAEVEHSLSVLDGAILIVSAVEGVQAQTRVLMQTLKENRIPTVIFMNKLDRLGADYKKVCQLIRTMLDEHICELTEVVNEGNGAVRIQSADPLKAGWLDTLSLRNDDLLRDFVNEAVISEDRLYRELCRQAKQGNAYPLLAGSAAKGIGVNRLLSCLADFFPVTLPEVVGNSNSNPLSGIVFKIVRSASGERAVFIRLFAGVIQVRNEIPVISQGGEPIFLKVKQLRSLQDGKWLATDRVTAGDIAILTGGNFQVGDVLGAVSDKMKLFSFQKPPIQVKVSAERQEEEAILHNALTELTMEDPFLQYAQDRKAKENTIHVFGKIQQEILAETIVTEYGIKAVFSAPKVMCIEKPVSAGKAVEYIGEAANPFLATVGFRVEPGAEGSGVEYRLEAELGSLLLSFQKAIKETVTEVLREGLYGWPVTDIVVTLTHTGYDSVLSTAKDFRRLVPLVLMTALKRAATDVYEPVSDMQLSIPESSLSKVLSRLAVLESCLQEPEFHGNAVHLNGTIPVRTAELLKVELHSLTKGEGMISFRPGGYMLVNSAVPENQRRQLNPLNRGEYLQQLNNIIS